MKVWLPLRLGSLAAAVMAASLTACAVRGNSSQSGSEVASTQPVARSSAQPLQQVTASDERTLACLHCAP